MEAKGLSVRGFLWFSVAEPRATSNPGIMQRLCQTGRPQEQTPPRTDSSMHRAKVPLCDLLRLPGRAPGESGCRYLQSRLRENKQWKFPPLITGADFVAGRATKGRVGSCSACSWPLSLTTTLFLPILKTSLQLKAFRPAEYQTCANLCSL